MPAILQITVEDLKVRRDQKASFKLVDCREQDEYDTCCIEGSVLIPLSQFANRAPQELNPDEEIVIHCHHGGRSQRACEYLAGMGYKSVTNLSGGIDAWSQKIDPLVKRY